MRTRQELDEIERHKYFLSEKKGHDVGWDFAAQDWERNFAADFRREHSHGAGAESSAVSSPASSATATATEVQSPLATPARTGSPGKPGKLKGLLGRWFSS